jgi:hypothetical protein
MTPLQHNPQAEQLTENQKDARLLRQATHDYKTRRDARGKVLDELCKICPFLDERPCSDCPFKPHRDYATEWHEEELRQSKDGEW